MEEHMPGIGFEQIIGQKLAVLHLQNALRTGKISQAYLISGEKGTGKMGLALAFAAALLCEQREERDGKVEPCGKCHSCLQIQTGNHPDVVIATNERAGISSKTGVLGVQLARFVQADAQVKPYSGDYKIYIIPHAENLNQQAQNALLKTLEEPPAYAVFLLLARNTSVFLPTVLSRCVSLMLHPAPERELVKALGAAGVLGMAAVTAARLSHGNPGRCLELSKEELTAFRLELSSFLEKLKETDSHGILQFAEKVAGGRGDDPSHMEDFLDLGRSWYRDILVQKSTQSPESLIFQDKIKYIISAAAGVSFQGLERIQEAFDDAGRRRSSKESDTQIAELLLLRIRSILREAA